MNFVFFWSLVSIHTNQIHLWFLRCASNKVYISTTDGDIPQSPTKTLAINANGRPDNVVRVDAVNDGSYSWRVDCIEEGTGDVREGDVWTFTVDSSL